MSASLPPNFRAWRGWQDLIEHTSLYYGHHAKNNSRRPIQNTPADNTARIFLYAQNPDHFLSVGERVLEVYHSCLQFEAPEHQWHFSRVLGCGSFGLACLYEKAGGTSDKDEVVIKSELPTEAAAVSHYMPEIPKEVFHLAQVNDRKDTSGWKLNGTTHLRGFKYIEGNYSTQGDGSKEFEPYANFVEQPLYREWRTFMENCDFGTLTRLICTYKAWGYHVPEAFVWWTFAWLMEACKAMDQDETQPFHVVDGASSAHSVPGGFILNNDIKHDNIFIGGSRPHLGVGAPFDQYPCARMGDFGLSRLAKIDRHNQPGRFPRGTRPWMAPEKRDLSMGFDFRNHRTYPFYNQARVDPATWNAHGGHPPTTRDHCIGPEANVWGAAVAIYLLMSLEDISTVDEIVRYKIGHENVTRDIDSDSLYLFDIEDFPSFLEDEADYSDELKSLVRECLHVDPMKRPHVDDVLRATYDGIRQENVRLHNEFDTDEEIYHATRMAFTNEDWLEVPEGPFEFMTRSCPGMHGGGDHKVNMNWTEFHEVVEEWADPNAPTLVPPRQWRYYQPGDPAPAHWTAARPQPQGRLSFPLPLPYYGNDWILYVNEEFIAPYHQGHELPPGGRAWGPNHMNQG